MINKKQFIFLLLTFALLLFFILVSPYFGILLFSIITVYFFNPRYQKLLKRAKKRRRAITLTWLSIIICFLAPLAFITTTLVKQTGVFVEDLQDLSSQNTQTITNVTEKITDSLEKYLPTIKKQLNTTKIRETLISSLKTIGGKTATWVAYIGQGIISIFTNVLLYFILVTSLFFHHKYIISLVKKLLPLDAKHTEKYITKISWMGSSMIKGTLVVAIIQGIISWVSLRVGGVPYVIFWTLLIIFLCMIPVVGAGIIVRPTSVILILNGAVWQGVMILLVNLIIVMNIDNILRPRLVSSDATINPALLILSIFAGITQFGFIGMLYGPVFMIFIITTIEIYLETQKNNQLTKK